MRLSCWCLPSSSHIPEHLAVCSHPWACPTRHLGACPVSELRSGWLYLGACLSAAFLGASRQPLVLHPMERAAAGPCCASSPQPLTVPPGVLPSKEELAVCSAGWVRLGGGVCLRPLPTGLQKRMPLPTSRAVQPSPVLCHDAHPPLPAPGHPPGVPMWGPLLTRASCPLLHRCLSWAGRSRQRRELEASALKQGSEGLGVNYCLQQPGGAV